MRVACGVVALLVAPLLPSAAGPIDYGQAELRAAADARGLPASASIVNVELSMTLQEDAFEIVGAVIRGGSPRGVMYGLLEAARQLRTNGRLSPVRGTPVVRLRSVRRHATVADWTRNQEAWLELFSGLANERFNRMHIMLDDPLSSERIETLKMVSTAAQQRGIDLAIGLVEPVPQDVIALMASCPAVRAVHVDPETAPVIAEPVKEAGRYIVLESSAAFSPAVPVPLRIGSESPETVPCASPCSRYAVFRENAAPPAALSAFEGIELEGVPTSAWRESLFTMTKIAAPARRAAPAKKGPATATKAAPSKAPSTTKSAPAKKAAPTKPATTKKK